MACGHGDALEGLRSAWIGVWAIRWMKPAPSALTSLLILRPDRELRRGIRHGDFALTLACRPIRCVPVQPHADAFRRPGAFIMSGSFGDRASRHPSAPERLLRPLRPVLERPGILAGKTPHLRNVYTKVGMFGLGAFSGTIGGTAHTGAQVRGFGMEHDGAMDTVARGNQFAIFGGKPVSLMLNMQQFVFAFDTNLKPAVGQQWPVRRQPRRGRRAVVAGRPAAAGASSLS